MLRKFELEKLRRNSDFMKDWWTHGLEEHAKNVNIRKETELKELRQKMLNEQNKNRIDEYKIQSSINDAYSNIEKFERDLVMSQFKVDYEISKETDTKSIKERTARMRKILNEEIKQINKLEDVRREEEYIDFLTRRSKDEVTQG
jgi:hypothetical protein